MGFVHFVADSAGEADLTSFTVASGQPSAFQRSGIIASVALPSIRRSPSKSEVNQLFPRAFKVPACPGPISGPSALPGQTHFKPVRVGLGLVARQLGKLLVQSGEIPGECDGIGIRVVEL